MEQFDKETSELLTEFTARHNEINNLKIRRNKETLICNKQFFNQEIQILENINNPILLELQARGHFLDPNE